MPVSDPKHVAAMLVGEMHPEDGPEAELPDGEDGDPGEEQAAEEMMAAFQAQDPKALSDAMKSFVQICMSKY
jgi:hypothetical protein